MAFMDHIRACNDHDPAALIPFVVDGHQVGLTPRPIAESLCAQASGFVKSGFVKSGSGKSGFGKEGDTLSLSPSIVGFEERTAVVNEAMQEFRDSDLMPFWHNELFPVGAHFNAEPLFHIERSGLPLLGLPAYGVHINGFVRRPDGLHMWIGKRAEKDRLFPGLLDQIVAGGHGAGYSLRETVIKESGEEASIPEHLAQRAVPVSTISYTLALWGGLRQDTLFNYDIELPDDFVPRNADGEVDSFRLLRIEDVAEIVRTSFSFKFNCALVIIDFLLRHGILDPDSESEYHGLVKGLRG